MPKHEHAGHLNRRGFLGTAGLAATAAAGLGGAASLDETPEPKAELLPTIALGEHKVTRMVAGYNPIGGHSHATVNLSNHMRSYFTVERTVAFLQQCEAQGINTFQFDLTEKVQDALNILWQTDTKLQFICLHAERPHDASLEHLMTFKPIAVVHHGGVTDTLFRAGKADQVHDFVKKVHDHGVLAGVSSHNPDHIARVADEGWEVDLFMTCFHNLTRTREDMEHEFGVAIVGEPYVESDPPRMTAVVRQVAKPCLAFKILAAGRRCNNPKWVDQAFEYAFANIKKTDAVIVGMFPLYQDEVSIDVAFARKYA